MAGFSSNADEILSEQCTESVKPICSSENELLEKYNLNLCANWIKENNFSKVCLQFPDSLLPDSVDVALWLEKQLDFKPFILGDTTYSSCCVDEIAAEHINGDCIIHFGHACLSPTTRVPVFYVFDKQSLDVSHFVCAVSALCGTASTTSPVLLLYDVAYSHYLGEMHEKLHSVDDKLIVSELCRAKEQQVPCHASCKLHDGARHHATVKFGRGYCYPATPITTVVYIGSEESKNFNNFLLSQTGRDIYVYNGSNLRPVTITRVIRKRLYLVEKVKDAKIIGILVATLGVQDYMSAVESVRKLAKRKGKKCYIISVGAPNVAKLANFPEIELYVLISCPETRIDNEKDYLQPIVTLMEAELALNEARHWDEKICTDFRELLPGGDQFIPLPDDYKKEEPDISLITNKVRSVNDVEEITSVSGLEIASRPDLTVSLGGKGLADRTWQGLDQALGKTPVTKVSLGRSGIPQAYSNEQCSS